MRTCQALGCKISVLILIFVVDVTGDINKGLAMTVNSGTFQYSIGQTSPI